MALKFICLIVLSTLSLFLASCAQAPEERPAREDYSRHTTVVKQQKSLCLFLDGTMNDYDSHTNVRRLYELISARRSPDVLCFYDPGVGSNELPISGAIGGAGFSKNLSQAYDFLRQNYRTGDHIYMFGFSRGARQIQVLCDILDTCGMMPPNVAETSESTRLHSARRMISEYKNHAYQRSKPESEIRAAHRKNSGLHSGSIPVEFVGIFDCVESMANNVLRLLVHGKLKKGSYVDHKNYVYDLPKNVKRAYHAMALDETRGMYQVVKWVHPIQFAPGQILEQVWFPGGHGDVGGGYKESQSLAGLSLNWILEKLEYSRLAPSHFRVHEDLNTPLTDTANFGIAGKLLNVFRANSPRYELFWFDRKTNSKNPGSQAKAFDIMGTRPLVHESVLIRMKRSFASNAVADENNPYRPKQFIMEKPVSQISTQINEHQDWPSQPFNFFSRNGSTNTGPNLTSLEKRIKVVHTDASN